MVYLQSSVYETGGKESGACGVAIGTVSEKGKYVYVIYDMMVCSPTHPLRPSSVQAYLPSFDVRRM